MMYRTVNMGIWQDPWFVDLQPHAKCLFLYLFTNPRVTPCGAMEISLSQIAFETKIPAKRLEQELRAFGEKVAWWPERNTIVVRNFYKHQRANSSDNFTKAARKALAALFPEAKAWVGDVYPELLEGMDTPKHTHPQPIPNPSPTQGDKETVTVTETVAATETATAPETEEPPNPPREFPAEFVEFWDRYPSGHGSRPKAFQAWKKVRAEHPAIMAGLDAWLISERWQKGMVKAAEIWLRDRLWENPAPPGTGGSGQFLPGSGDAAYREWRRNGGVG